MDVDGDGAVPSSYLFGATGAGAAPLLATEPPEQQWVRGEPGPTRPPAEGLCKRSQRFGDNQPETNCR